MTTPGGVANLPAGALTLETLQSKLQDMSATANRQRAADRVPSIFNNSTGGSILSDLSPFGIITRIWAEVNSLVAQADPADIQGPEDLPPLLLEFIEGLPVVGELVGLLEAILGNYDGDDEVLRAIQQVFLPIRLVMQMIAGNEVGFPTPEEIIDGWENLGSAAANALRDAMTGIVNSTPTDLDNWLLGLLTNNSPLNPARLSENLWPLGAFPAGSVNGQGIWIPDPEVTHTADSTGSVRVVANGTMKALLGVPTTVVVGQQVDVSVFVRWGGYAGTGAPIQLHIAEYVHDGSSSKRLGSTMVTSLGPGVVSGGWAELAGTYTVPEGVNEIRCRLVVTPSAVEGTIHFDDATGRNKLLLEWIGGLPEQLQDQIARWQSIIDAAVQAFTKSTVIGNTMEDLLFALNNIRPENISGLWGPGTLPEALQKFLDAIMSGGVGADGEGAGIPDIRDLLEQLGSGSWLGNESWKLLANRYNRKLDSGLLPSERSNFNLSEINSSFTLAPGTSLIAFDLIEESMPLGAISWLGWGTSGITEFYVNVYKVGNLNAAGGEAVLLHASPNIVGILDSGATSPLGGYNRYEPDAPPGVEMGDIVAYELITVGGSHTIRGRAYNLPEDNRAPTSAHAAIRAIVDPDSPPATFDKNDITWSQNAAWIGIAVDTGSGDGHHDPEQQQLNSATSLPVPNWCDIMDWVLLPPGGDGADGFTGFYGNPGSPGSYKTATLVRGEHFSGTSTIITFDGVAEMGIPGFTLTANRGANGSGVRPVGLGQPVGRGPGDLEYNGMKCRGGGDQSAYGGKGITPGGAGNGGHWFGLYTQGGKGGAARAWVQFRKVQPGETPAGSEPDNTAPNISGLTVDVSATSTTLTLTPSGAVDDA
ncbi:hypothetical protein [Mycobacterium sp. NS-7484]|uniref:hypothetical protein n=1 Tax=Mycobacterium sp. NS-7484 TaxID=1834161 RepID=UPI001152DA91|nr:hypothetical protein [Mycobacterium sp. NS-7484]